MHKSPSLTLLVLSFALGVVTAQFTLSQNLSGNNFLQGFNFVADVDDSKNGGNVHFASQSTAQSMNLTSVDPDTGRVILKVDNTQNGETDPNFGRYSFYLTGTEPMDIGSLLIFDANHIPFGCSVWPSLFTQGQGQWPTTGEIDIIEGVNLQADNQFSLHTGDENCKQPTSVASNQTGDISNLTIFGDSGLSNCNVTGADNNGCVVTETKSGSFGSSFAAQGGGIYALLWDTDGIAMWYFARGSVPSDIGDSSGSPDPTTWGKASAWYPASSCNPSTDFGPQLITIYIDICGSFAGVPSVFEETCSSVAPNCSALVQDPSNYDDAYWDINYLHVFTKANSSNSTTTGTSSGSGNSTGSSSSSNSASSTLGIREYFFIPVSLAFLGFLVML